MGCVVPFFFYYYDHMKKKKNTKVSLFIHPPLSVVLGEPDWRRNLIRNGQKSERDTLHHSEVPRFSEMPHSSPFSCLQCPPLSLSLFLQLSLSLPSPLFLSSAPAIFTILPSTQHLPGLTPDTALLLTFHPFPAQPVCCGDVVVL